MAALRKKWSARDPKTFTHLLLDGGKLHVPDQQHTLFLGEYSNAVARAEKLFVVETRTSVFRMFVDFDFKPPPAPEIIAAGVQSACSVAGYYFDTQSRAVVLRKDVDAREKIGVHLTWDAVFVTAATANAFRNHLVKKLEDACGDVDWRDVVDAAVYSGSGLRMPWSSKRDAPGVYRPAATCSAEGEMRDVPPPKTAGEIREWVKWTSIRAPDAAPTKTCVVTADDGGHVVRDSGSSSGAAATAESLGEHVAVLEKVHATLPAAYADQKFTGMHRFGDFCAVLRSDSKKCGNKGYEAHTKNTVYFVVLRKGYAYQRCYCRKDAVRAGGVTCTDYVSDAWTVPQEIVDALWPPLPKQTSKMMALLDTMRPQLSSKRKRM